MLRNSKGSMIGILVDAVDYTPEPEPVDVAA